MGQSVRKFTLCDNEDLELFSLVWLDASVNSTAENLDVQKQLRALINQLKTFDNTHDCLQYIRNISKQNQIILIVSGRLGREIVPRIHRLRQVARIYIYCYDKEKNEKWAQKFPKIKDVIVNLDELVSQIRCDRTQRNHHEIDEPFLFNIYKNPHDKQFGCDKNNAFIHFELLIDCLLRTKSNLTDKTQLITLCKDIYQGNQNELNIIDQFDKTYESNQALSWYINNCFATRLLDKAFQTQTIDLLYLFRFFLHDIREQLELNKCLSLTYVYREQYLSNNELELFENSIGDLISINSFLSTNLNRQKALKYVNNSNDLKHVLFEIEADPHLTGIKSFGSTNQDDEILFMVGSIFRINNIVHQHKDLSIIKLTLCSDNDLQLKHIFKSLKSEINENKINLLLFGDVLWKIGKFNEAEKFYQHLLTELSNEKSSEIAECYYALGNLAMENNDCNTSFEWHQKSLDLKKEILQENDPSMADSYNSIGDIQRKQGDSIHALESYNTALNIWTQAYGNDHPKIAMCLNNIGCIYGEEKNYEKTLEYQQKALTIMQRHFSSDHLCLGHAHNNIGSVYRYLGDYELALEHYQISVGIKLKSLSSTHPLIASTYSNIANVYEDMNSYQQALEYYEKAASIYRHRFPPTYPDNLRIIEDIRRVSSKLKQ